MTTPPPPAAQPATGPLVLVVEDEPRIAEVLEAYLHRDGYRTVRAEDGVAAVEVHRARRPALVLLDVMLPARDGFEVLRLIRQDSGTPVIMVTARDEDLDKLLGLGLGADDYVLKPFSPPEVVARVKAVLRRAAPPADPRAVLRVGPLSVDPAATSAEVDGQLLDLTAAEYRLLEHLARSPGRTFTRAQLLQAALPDSAALERVIDAHLANLRRKLAAAGAPPMITTVRGLGYRLTTSAGTDRGGAG